MDGTGAPAWMALVVVLLQTVALVWIGFRQHRWEQRSALAAERSANLQLLDRRIAFFEEVQRFLAKRVTLATLQPEEVLEFVRVSRPANYLFGPEVTAAMAGIEQRAMAFCKRTRELDDLPVGPAREAAVAIRSEDLEWFRRMLDEVERLVLPYLRAVR